MTNVLIPTDFSMSSLELIDRAAQTLPDKLNIFLFHAFDMPESLQDALMRTGMNNHYSLITEQLRMRCKQIKMAYDNISNISFRTMHGDTAAVFRNFAEANEIDVIILPQDYFFIPAVRASVNPERMLRKSGIKIVSQFTYKKITAKTLKPVARPARLSESRVALQ